MIPQTKSPRFDTFDVVVRDICAYLGDTNATKQYALVARFLRRALEELNIHLVGNIKSILLTVEDNLTAPLPVDFNYVSKMGVCCNGKLRILHQNDNLCVPDAEEFWKCCTCPDEQETMLTDRDCHKSDVESGKKCSHCTFHNVIAPDGLGLNSLNAFGGMGMFLYPYWYGHHSKNYSGSYKIDQHNGQVIFGGGFDVCPGHFVVMEYNAHLDNGDYAFIPREYFETLLHKTAAFVKKGGDQQWELTQFRIAWKMLKRTKLSVTLEEIVQAIQGGFSSSPRR